MCRQIAWPLAVKCRIREENYTDIRSIQVVPDLNITIS